MLALVDALRRLDVGRDHALLDELVGHEPLDGARRCEPCRARRARSSSRADRSRSRRAVCARARTRVDGLKLLQCRLELRVPAARPRRCEKLRAFGVRQARRGTHHGLVEARARDLAARATRSSRRPSTAGRRAGFSEHSPFDSASGSIGTTRSGKYTDVPRARASRSSGVVGSHIVAHVGDRDEQPPAVAAAARSNTASSKSFASSPSIVTSGTLRKSSRPFFRLLRHFGRPTSAPRRARLRPVMRNAVREDRDFRLDAGLILARRASRARGRRRGCACSDTPAPRR